ncbi:MAG: hypothetical protein ABIF89_01720 [bacterium]
MATQATQQFLEVDQVKEGIMILKNKGLRGVLMVSSINFALKSEDEQDATIYQFQNFLNSLDFFCQILIQSRRLNITGYLERIKILEKTQPNELLRVQTNEYRVFIQRLIETGSILSKMFFVIVPYSSSEQTGGKETKKELIPELTEEVFQRCRNQLLQRMEFVAVGLKRCGLQSIPLTTPEIIELLWSLHHPKEAEIGFFPEFPSDLMT